MTVARIQRDQRFFLQTQEQIRHRTRFDAAARGFSNELWLSRQRGWVLAGIGLIAGAAAGWLSGRASRRALPA